MRRERSCDGEDSSKTSARRVRSVKERPITEKKRLRIGIWADGEKKVEDVCFCMSTGSMIALFVVCCLLFVLSVILFLSLNGIYCDAATHVMSSINCTKNICKKTRSLSSFLDLSCCMYRNNTSNTTDVILLFC